MISEIIVGLLKTVSAGVYPPLAERAFLDK